MMNSSDLTDGNLSCRYQRQVYLTTALAVLAAILQSVVLLTVYEGEKGLYEVGDLFGHAVGIFLFVAAVFVFILQLLLPKVLDKQPSHIPPYGHASAFLAAMCGCSILVVSLMIFNEVGAVEGALGIIAKVMLIPASLSAIYFLMVSLNQKNSTRLVVLSFFPEVWVALLLMRLYFERSSAINDPMKILLQLSFSAIMLAFLAESRVRVGKQGVRFLLGITSLAVIVSAASAVSMLVFRLSGGELSASTCMIVVTQLLATVYLLLRLYAYRALLAEPFIRENGVAESEMPYEETASVDEENPEE